VEVAEVVSGVAGESEGVSRAGELDRAGAQDDKTPVFPMELTSLPGHELVRAGLDDLARGVESQEALLVSIGAPRLRRAGIDVPEPYDDAEHRLYDLLAAEDSDSAHGRYNALVRRLVSFERAADALGRADVGRG
jgi:hypothetical protein